MGLAANLPPLTPDGGVMSPHARFAPHPALPLALISHELNSFFFSPCGKLTLVTLRFVTSELGMDSGGCLGA